MKYICTNCNKQFDFKGCMAKLKCPACNKRTGILTLKGYTALKKNNSLDILKT